MQYPFFSIIVPTHGRPAALRNCIEALGRLAYPPDCYEIIVVFDGDESIALPTLPSITLQICTQPHSGPAAARNKGASQAIGDYLAFTDDDCAPAVDWLRQLTAAFNQFPEYMIGGQTVNALPENVYASASQCLVDFLYQHHNRDPRQARFITSNNMALSRDRFLEIGGFDDRFPLAAGEDREFCHRWLTEGNRIYYQSTALVHHTHPLTLAGFWRQHLNYGRGAYLYHNQQALNQNEPLTLEKPAFYLDLLRHPLRPKNGRPSPTLFLLFLLMQLANTVGFLHQWSK